MDTRTQMARRNLHMPLGVEPLPEDLKDMSVEELEIWIAEFVREKRLNGPYWGTCFRPDL